MGLVAGALVLYIGTSTSEANEESTKKELSAAEWVGEKDSSVETDTPIAKEEAPQETELEVEERVDNMREVDLTVPQKDAKTECERCMNCGVICYDKSQGNS